MADEKRRRARSGGEQAPIRPLSREQKRILQWLRKVRFKKQLFGGVSERDVWKKIEELNSMYNVALVAERARYDALLAQQRQEYDQQYAPIDTTPNGRDGG